MTQKFWSFEDMLVKNYSIFNNVTWEYNLTTTDYQGKEINVTFDMQLTYQWESSNKECHLGSSYPIDFPQCRLY